ncbi:hypothetical protein CALCODRAFT_511308 [Calocera cornea HHB12733]|uniref:Uncharacterized protein n=1 Tax=Calocera cornea HHB12733 TaxID=1353952 RepID=A0A165DUX9_9BASI|nr:hypothetical protein CALCODRAFT_511308 [Calocera cornea HHB12733]
MHRASFRPEPMVTPSVSQQHEAPPLSQLDQQQQAPVSQESHQMFLPPIAAISTFQPLSESREVEPDVKGIPSAFRPHTPIRGRTTHDDSAVRGVSARVACRDDLDILPHTPRLDRGSAGDDDSDDSDLSHVSETTLGQPVKPTIASPLRPSPVSSPPIQVYLPQILAYSITHFLSIPQLNLLPIGYLHKQQLQRYAISWGVLHALAFNPFADPKARILLCMDVAEAAREIKGYGARRLSASDSMHLQGRVDTSIQQLLDRAKYRAIHLLNSSKTTIEPEESQCDHTASIVTEVLEWYDTLYDSGSLHDIPLLPHSHSGTTWTNFAMLFSTAIWNIAERNMPHAIKIQWLTLADSACTEPENYSLIYSLTDVPLVNWPASYGPSPRGTRPSMAPANESIETD